MTNHIIFYLFSSIKKKSKSTCTLKSLSVVYRGSLSICLVSAVIGQDCTDWLVGKICQNLKASVCALYVHSIMQTGLKSFHLNISIF